SFAEPEGDCRRLAFGVYDAYAAFFHARDSPRRIAELKDVAGKAFDGEILVDGSDEGLFRVQDYVKIRGVGNRSTIGQRRQTRPLAPPQPLIDGVVMQVSVPAAESCGIPFGEHANGVIELFPGQVAVRVSPPHKVKQPLFGPFFTRDRRDYLLGE